MTVLVYFLIGFLGAIIAHAYNRINPVPAPPEVSFMEQHFRQQERTGVTLCVLFLWPICLVVLIAYSVFKLADYVAAVLLKLLGANESNPRP